MSDKEKLLENIECMERELMLPFGIAERKEIIETCEEWEMRAIRLDKKMSQLDYMSITPANVFKHS